MAITLILSLTLIGFLSYIFWQNSVNVKPPVSGVFSESLDKFKFKYPIGSNNNYDVYTLPIHQTLLDISGNVLVYSKSIGKAVEIKKPITIYANETNNDAMEQQDDKYLVIDSGNGASAVRQKDVILLKDMGIVTFRSVGKIYYWQDRYIYACNDETYNGRPSYLGYSQSICSTNLLTKKESKVVSSKPLSDYNVTSVTGGALYYTETSYGSVNDMTDGKFISNNLTLDLINTK